MAVLIKAIAAVLFLGLLGGMLGAMAGLVLIPHPVDACGMWWLVALVEGAMYGLTGGPRWAYCSGWSVDWALLVA